VEVFAVLARNHGQADHRVFIDADQAAGLAHATTLPQVLQNRKRFVFREFGPIQGSALAFGEAFLASATGQDAACFVGSIAEANPQVALAALAVVRAVGVLAAEDFQVVHGSSRRSRQGENLAGRMQSA